MMSSQGLAIAATAMAVSGTVVLLTLCRQKPPLLISLALDPAASPPHHQALSLRPCIKNSSSNSSSGEKRRAAKKKRKSKGSGKKVQFSDRVEEFYFPVAEVPKRKPINEADSCRVRSAQMPANQMALYRGILRDRVHRVPACSY